MSRMEFSGGGDDEGKLSSLPSFDYDVREDLLERIMELLAEDTLQSHRQAQALIREASVAAVMEWDIIHAAASHHLSIAHEPNHFFTEFVLASLRSKTGRVLEMVEIGSGMGRDAIRIVQSLKCHITGVDSSEVAVREAQRRRDELKIRGVKFVREDFREILKPALTESGLKPKLFDVIYACSATHYDAPQVMKWETIPTIAGAIADDGDFIMATKLADSDSAQAQLSLYKDPNYRITLDEIDSLIRVYPKRPEVLEELLSHSFGQVRTEVKTVEGYDVVGAKEHFVCAHARFPKRHECLPKPGVRLV